MTFPNNTYHSGSKELRTAFHKYAKLLNMHIYNMQSEEDREDSFVEWHVCYTESYEYTYAYHDPDDGDDRCWYYEPLYGAWDNLEDPELWFFVTYKHTLPLKRLS